MPTTLEKLHVWECAWCQYQILVLEPPYPTIQKYGHSTSETSCVSTGNMRGASAKYWYQHQCIQHYTNTPKALQKPHVCPLGMCVVLVPNIGISTSVSNTTQIRSQHFRNFMCVHWECAWCQYQIFVLTQAYPMLHRYAHGTSETLCMSTGNVRGDSPNISLRTNISNTTHIRPEYFRNFMCVHWECAWCQCEILVLTQVYPMLHRYAHGISETSCVSTGNVRGASPNIGLRTTVSNTTQLRPQHFRNFMCVHWECVWFQCQILVLEQPYPTLHKYANSTTET